MKMRNNILLVTPTLGLRATLHETIRGRSVVGGVDHIIVAPINRIEGIKQDFGHELNFFPENRNDAGVYSAVNDVILSTGEEYEWVAYINDDDYWLLDMRFLIDKAKDSSADILYGRVRFIDFDGNHLAYSSSTRFYKLYPILASRGIYLFTQQALLIRRELFQKLGGFNEKYKIQGDNDLWIRAIRSGARCEFVNKVCAVYRMHPGQLSAGPEGTLERSLMLAQHHLKLNSFRSFLAMVFYRLINMPNYIGRMAKGKTSIMNAAGRVDTK